MNSRTEVARFLALGDSYTIGQDVSPAARWPAQLVARLRQQGLDMADPVLIAQTGWTTADLQAGIDRANPQGPFDLVSLLIGVNNQYRGESVARYRSEFARLLQRAISLAGADPGRVLVLSIPDWGVTPFAAGQQRQPARIAAEIDAFNAVNREEATRRRVAYVDVTPLSRKAAVEVALLAADGLHPSGQMYAAWVALMLPIVRRQLPSALL